MTGVTLLSYHWFLIMNKLKKLVPFRLSLIFLLCIFSVYPSVSVFAQAQDTKSTTAPTAAIKVLMVGNSFSRDAATYLGDLAHTGGKNIVLLNAFNPGCSLSGHVNGINAAEKDPQSPQARMYTHEGSLGGGASLGANFSLREALESDKWDYVTIQQASANSYDPKTYEPFAAQLVAYIRKYAPQAEILVHETWAYREDDELFKDGSFTSDKMHEELQAAYTQLAKNYHLRMIPVGDAFQAARHTDRWHFVPDPNYDLAHPTPGVSPDQKGSLNVGFGWDWNNKKFSGDTHHLNASGKYLGSAVLYEALFGESVKDVAFCPKELDADSAADLRRIADETEQDQKKQDAINIPSAADSTSTTNTTQPATDSPPATNSTQPATNTNAQPSAVPNP